MPNRMFITALINITVDCREIKVFPGSFLIKIWHGSRTQKLIYLVYCPKISIISSGHRGIHGLVSVNHFYG